MTRAALFQWVVFDRGVPDSFVKLGDRAVVVDHLPPNSSQTESGYTLEAFKAGETLDVVSVPISWVTPLPEVWGKNGSQQIKAS